MIRIPQVRVVDEEGAQLGVMPTAQALAMAQERGYDLVEVAPMAAPPVVKFLDFGQYKYELTKKEKEAKRRQRSVTFKEVRLKPKIGQGDFDTKVRRAIDFLEDGDRIKVAVQFRGRELTHPEIGRNLLTRFTEQIKDHGMVERQPLLEGKSMHVTVASTHKPKAPEMPAAGQPRQARPSDGGEAQPAVIAPTGAPAAVEPVAIATADPVAAATPPAATPPAATRPATAKPAATKQAAEAAAPAEAAPAAPAKRTAAPTRSAPSAAAEPAAVPAKKESTAQPSQRQAEANRPNGAEPDPVPAGRPASARGSTDRTRNQTPPPAAATGE
jgi:translation initiation factor IF-3